MTGAGRGVGDEEPAGEVASDASGVDAERATSDIGKVAEHDRCGVELTGASALQVGGQGSSGREWPVVIEDQGYAAATLEDADRIAFRMSCPALILLTTLTCPVVGSTPNTTPLPRPCQTGSPGSATKTMPSLRSASPVGLPGSPPRFHRHHKGGRSAEVGEHRSASVGCVDAIERAVAVLAAFGVDDKNLSRRFEDQAGRVNPERALEPTSEVAEQRARTSGGIDAEHRATAVGPSVAIRHYDGLVRGNGNAVRVDPDRALGRIAEVAQDSTSTAGRIYLKQGAGATGAGVGVDDENDTAWEPRDGRRLGLSKQRRLPWWRGASRMRRGRSWRTMQDRSEPANERGNGLPFKSGQTRVRKQTGKRQRPVLAPPTHGRGGRVVAGGGVRQNAPKVIIYPSYSRLERGRF